jgi:hypothetical protein
MAVSSGASAVRSGVLTGGGYPSETGVNRGLRSQTVGVSDDLPDEAARLFREPPERFVAARDALVADLRSRDRAAEAAAVKAIRRPTALVWALNQLSERDAGGVEELLAAGAELRAAQQATLSSSGTGADRLRSATDARRASVSRLVRAAASLLDESGHASRPEEIASALESASVDDDAGERLSSGTLRGLPPPPSGFGGVLGLTAIEGGGGGDAAATKSRPRRPSPEASAAERAAAESEVAGLRRDRDAAARRARTAHESADRLAARLDGMRERLEAAEADHAEAAARASAADLEAARTERELTSATEHLDRLRDPS